MESSTPPPAPSRSLPSREDCWSEEATSTLVDAWGSRYMELNRGNLRQKDWQDVADIVNSLHGHTIKSRRTDVQCKNRLDTLKKKYKTEKAKIADSDGKITSSWPFFSRLDLLIGSSYNKLQKMTPIDLTTSMPIDLMNSPPMAVPLPSIKQPVPLPLPPELPEATATPPQLKLVPVILPQKRPLPGSDDSHFRRNYSGVAVDSNFRSNYSAVAAAAAKPGGESSEEEMENEVANGEPKGEEEEGMRVLAKAIERFGEIYERVEGMKQKQILELEKQRMQFSKELEVQRMHLFMDSQVHLEKLKHAKRSGSDENSSKGP